MANVLLDMAMSLDGFTSGPNGEDHGLHDYFFSPVGPTVEVIEEGFKTTGTIIMSRHSYEAGVAHGIESALAQARAVTDDRDVVIGGGANIAQQYLQAGLVDEMQIHLIPVLLGTGIRLFDHLDTKAMKLESTRVIDGSGATHLRFRVVK